MFPPTHPHNILHGRDSERDTHNRSRPGLRQVPADDGRGLLRKSRPGSQQHHSATEALPKEGSEPQSESARQGQVGGRKSLDWSENHGRSPQKPKHNPSRSIRSARPNRSCRRIVRMKETKQLRGERLEPKWFEMQRDHQLFSHRKQGVASEKRCRLSTRGAWSHDTSVCDVHELIKALHIETRGTSTILNILADRTCIMTVFTGWSPCTPLSARLAYRHIASIRFRFLLAIASRFQKRTQFDHRGRPSLPGQGPLKRLRAAPGRSSGSSGPWLMALFLGGGEHTESKGHMA